MHLTESVDPNKVPLFTFVNWIAKYLIEYQVKSFEHLKEQHFCVENTIVNRFTYF